jgi:hypothetical protein
VLVGLAPDPHPTEHVDRQVSLLEIARPTSLVHHFGYTPSPLLQVITYRCLFVEQIPDTYRYPRPRNG